MTSRFNPARAFLLAAALVVLSSCGGSSAPLQPSSLALPRAALAPTDCFKAATGGQVGYHFQGIECVRTFEPMYAPALRQAAQSLGSQPVFTWPQLATWAEANYPQFFHGPVQSGTYQDFTYRHYPATGNYIALRNTDMIYVMGPATDDDLLYVGTLNSLLCGYHAEDCGGTPTPAPTPTPFSSQNPDVLAWAQRTYPQHFTGPWTEGVADGFAYRHYTATNNYVAVNNGRIYLLGPVSDNTLRDVGTIASVTTATSSAGGDFIPGSSATTIFFSNSPTPGTIDQAGDEDWYVLDLTAGTSYTFNMEGVDTGKGTLTDPILRIINGSNQQVASNDDVSYPGNRNSRITYTPTVSGRYYLSAQAFTSSTGTYLLSGSGGTSATGTAGSGTGSAGGGDTSTVAPVAVAVTPLGPLRPDGQDGAAGPKVLERFSCNGRSGTYEILSDYCTREHRATINAYVCAGNDRPNIAYLTAGITAAQCIIQHSTGVYLERYQERLATNQAYLASLLAAQSSGGTGTSGSGLAGTWCADVSGNQNCWVFDNDTGSSTGRFYQQSINQYSGTLTNTMTWSATGGSLTYRFTQSVLTNSTYNYSQPVNQPAYTFPYTLTSSVFTFQNIAFYRR